MSISAGEFWLESIQSPTSGFLGSVPLNLISYLVGFSSVGWQSAILILLDSDSPSGVVARCPEVHITSTSEALDGGECLF